MEAPPLSKTPKKLLLQSAERIALQVVYNVQTTLIEYLFDGSTNDKILHLVYLNRLKIQYWKDMSVLVEPCRRVVSDSITEVMELQSRKTECLPCGLHSLMRSQLETRAPYLLVMFAAQILFTYGAGYSNAMDMLNLISVRSKTTKVFNLLLEAAKPFNVEKLSTAFIKFEDPLPVVTLIKNSPCLRQVYLINNCSISVFNILRRHSKNIECIEFKLFSYYAVLTRDCSLCDFLFETFFEGMGMEAVMQSLDARGKLERSFPKLKEVTINSNSVNTRVPVNEFVYCLQHSYPNIKTKWFKYINVYKPSSKFRMSSFQLQPPFSGRGRHDWDVVEVGYVSDMEIIDDVDKSVEEFPRINHIVIEVDSAFNAEVRRFIEGLTRRHKCDSIELVLYKHSLDVSPNVVSSIFNDIGKRLQVLRLSLPHGLIGNELIMALNACLFLQVLSLETNVLEYENPPASPFKTFSKLVSLTVDIQAKLERVKFASQTLMMHLIEAAPSIQTLKLSNVTDETLERMIDLSLLLKVVTFQIGSPFPKNLKDCIEKLPSLSVLTLNHEYWHYNVPRDFIYFTLKQIFQNTSLRIFGIGKLSRYPLSQSYEFFS